MHIHTTAGDTLEVVFSQICFPRDLKGLARIRETGEYLSNPHPQSSCNRKSQFFKFFGSIEKEQAGKRLEAQSSSKNNA